MVHGLSKSTVNKSTKNGKLEDMKTHSAAPEFNGPTSSSIVTPVISGLKEALSMGTGRFQAAGGLERLFSMNWEPAMLEPGPAGIGGLPR